MVDRNDFKREFKNLVVETVLKHGSTLSLNDSIYRWNDLDADYHIQGKNTSRRERNGLPAPTPCQWFVTDETTFKEENVYQFGDTLNGTEAIFINVGPVSCTCGELKDRSVRYEGRTANFIPLMFMDEAQFTPEYK